jgi:hypothetical protein
MSTRTEELFFLLREGATQEEQWSWEALGDLCRAGELGGRDRVFLPARNEWVCLSDTELSSKLPEAGEAAGGPSEGDSPLEAEYRAVLDRLEESPESVDTLIEAGVLARDLDDAEASRRHFQKVLDLQPFHGRAAQEIRRRFSPAECRQFRLLVRPAQPWDDLGETGAFAFTRGWVHALVPAAVLSLISIFPGSGPFTALLLLWWTAVTASCVSRGDDRVPTWTLAVERPLSLAVLAVGAVVVLVEIGLLVAGLAGLGMVIQDGSSMGIAAYAAGSPLIVVCGALICAAYIPGAVTALAGPRPARAMAPWLVVRDVVAIGQEYVVTAFAMGLLALVFAGVYAATSIIPVFGEIIAACAAALAAPIAGYVIGRLRARFAHRLPA